jgi:glycosyltransferase involved in cell wall biosynthesis
MKLVREFAPQVIWSTYPIATAHLIGAALQRRTGLPWLADFRDPMAQDGYPADPLTRQQYQRIESDTIHRAAVSMFTTPGAATEYRRRYPDAAARIEVLENGFDEETFARAAGAAGSGPLNPGALTLLHSGIVYPSERDPTQLMAALRSLHDRGSIQPGRFRLRFRAAVAEDLLRRLAAEHGVTAYVEILGAVPYAEALAEMLRADALLVLQASNCNAQIPAKIYEYLRAGRPLLCLTDPSGDTAGVMRGAGLDAIARLDDAEDIAALLDRFVSARASGLRTVADPARVHAASREGRTQALAARLDALAAAAR